MIDVSATPIDRFKVAKRTTQYLRCVAPACPQFLARNTLGVLLFFFLLSPCTIINH
jgi:hypothetical protein